MTRKIIFWIFFLCSVGMPLRAEDVLDLYRRAVRLYRGGDVEGAQKAFEAVQKINPHYKKTAYHLTRCRLRGEERENARYIEDVAARAREVLDVRAAVVKHLSTQFPQVEWVEKDGGVEWAFLPEVVFAPQGEDFSKYGDAFMAALKEYAATYRRLYVTVAHERGAHADDLVQKQNDRRATVLGAFFFRQCGVPPQNISLRAVGSQTDRLRLSLTPATIPPAPAEKDIQGVAVRVKTALWTRGEAPLPIDVSLLDPAGIRKWKLRLLNMADGRSVWEYAGGADLWASLNWDGKTATGRQAPAGEYQAFLTAEGFGAARREDSVGFVVKNGPREVSPPKAQPPSDDEKVGRKWAQVIRFSFDQSLVEGASVLDVKRLAQTLRAFPTQRLVIEGFADPEEENAPEVALRRAEAVRRLLVDEHGVEAARLTARGKLPRRTVEGETQQKAVAFFIESE